jgi:hypothetical protein
MAKTMMAPSRMNKASMPCLGASMISPGNLCSRKVQKKPENKFAPKQSKTRTNAVCPKSE